VLSTADPDRTVSQDFTEAAELLERSQT
jgi:hypothetical protein